MHKPFSPSSIHPPSSSYSHAVDREHLQPFVAVRNALLREPFPASTLVIVSGFARPEFVVEVEVTAAAPA